MRKFSVEKWVKRAAALAARLRTDREGEAEE